MFVGGGIFYVLKLTVLYSKPVTAKIISDVIAVIASYILNREWSFKKRGRARRWRPKSGVKVPDVGSAPLTIMILCAGSRIGWRHAGFVVKFPNSVAALELAGLPLPHRGDQSRPPDPDRRRTPTRRPLPRPRRDRQRPCALTWPKSGIHRGAPNDRVRCPGRQPLDRTPNRMEHQEIRANRTAHRTVQLKVGQQTLIAEQPLPDDLREVLARINNGHVH
jgi:hypothetical protein